MSLFNIYKIIVNCKDSNNYWDDVVINNASNVLFNFKEEDWLMLSKEWINQSSFWQEVCAETLGKVETKHSIGILYAMLNSDNENLMLVAVGSLASFSADYLKSTLNLAQFSQINFLAKNNNKIGLLLSNIVQEISRV